LAENKDENYQNIFNYFNLFEDFYKLKDAIFSENQKFSFNLLRKKDTI